MFFDTPQGGDVLILMINRTLDNRYTILERIGGGGMADVYRAHDELLDRSVAVKVLKAQFVDDEGFVANFRREALAAAKLSHPNIVNIYDVGFEKDIYYIIMEYISGETLKGKIEREAPFPVQEAIGIGLEIAEALEHAHQNNIIHCDVKPHNILITRSGRVKVTDFGIARAVTSNTVNNTNTILGSVHYFSPEQAQGTAISAKSDIYSLGIVLYEMLTAILPFSGDSPIGIALKHIQEDPIPLREVNPSILPLVEAIVLKAMAKVPRQRFENIGEMITDLKMTQNYLRDDIARRPFGANNDFSAQTMPQERIYVKDDKTSLPNYTRDQLNGSLKKNTDNVLPATRQTKKWFIIGLLFLLLASAAAAFIGFGNFGALKEVAVPDMKGKQIDAARNILTDIGLKVSVTDIYDDKVLPGYVVSQQPEAGITVKEGRVIVLAVSKGGELVSVPILTGLVRHNAEVQITNSALKLGKVDEQYSDDIQKDFVISQNPRPPAQVAKGSMMDIVISKGSMPKKIILPDFKGLPISTIVTRLESLSIKLGPVTETETNDFPAGTIINQSPLPGSEIEAGTSVGFLTAKAAPNNTVDNGNAGQTVKRAIVQAVIPAASGNTKKQTLKIIVTDSKGRSVVYEESHSPGEKVEKTVEGIGQVRIQVYVNNRLLQEQML